ncbi:MAG: alpha/beta hydrolase [Colwellia sp.]
MINKNTITLIKLLSLFLSTLFFSTLSAAEQYRLNIVQPTHGKLHFNQVIPKNGLITKGEKITVTATADPGYALDSLYQSIASQWGNMYYESMTSEYTFIMDNDKTVSALFLPEVEFEGFSVKQNVVYAQPGVKPLKYDVFSPNGAKNLPIITIIHGGGWVINTEDVMRGMARQMAKTGRYVVVSVDYRWAGQADGDTKFNTMSDIISDVFGALAHIQEHAASYGGDPSRIAVTGDSAGGHLSATVATMTHKIGHGGFGNQSGVFEFMPSYLPVNKTVVQVRESLKKAIQVAAPSYGVFSQKKYGRVGLQHFSKSDKANENWSAAIAPINHIPMISERKIPHYLIRGTNDVLIKKEMLTDYSNALKAKGQKVKHVEVEGAGHAFFDWKPDQQTMATYTKFGIPYVKDTLAFFDEIFYQAG